MTTTLTVPGTLNGPPGTANGGVVCGVVADAVGPAASVRLSAPAPLDVPLTRRTDPDGAVRLLHGELVVAQGRPGRPDLSVPHPPSPSDAERASARSVALTDHPFPHCFVCGPLRPDGLRLFPGPLGDGGLLACAWTPDPDLARHGVVEQHLVWAALDCPSGFACAPPGTRAVLASMTAEVTAPVRTGARHVVLSWPLGSDGRKHRAGSALFTDDGQRLAVAETLWIEPRTSAPRPQRPPHEQ